MQHCSLSFFFFSYSLCTCLCHPFFLLLSYTHTHAFSFYFLSVPLSLALYVYVCVYMYTWCVRACVYNEIREIPPDIPLSSVSHPLTFSLPCFVFLLSSLSLSLFLPVSVVLRRLFFFFSFFFSFDGENSKFPCVLPRGQPLVRFATVGFPTLAKCCKVSLVSISSSPRSVSFFVFAVLRGRFLIGAVWWNHSSFALSVFFEWSVTMIAVKGEFLDLRSERLGNRNRSFKIRLVECSQFSLVNLRWMFEISKFRRRFEDFMKNNKYFRIFAI